MASVQDIMDLKAQVIQTSLDMASTASWADISMYDIAQALDASIDDVQSIFTNKDSIISAYFQGVDTQVTENLGGAFTGAESTKDQLFDIFMERFDILNENRAGVISFINALTLNPKDIIGHIPSSAQSVDLMLKIAGEATDGWNGFAKISAMMLIYANSLRVWCADDSPDLAATMASLDKGLSYFEKISL